MERPYLPIETSAGLGRDWPDARGILKNTLSLLIYLDLNQLHVFECLHRSCVFQR